MVARSFLSRREVLGLAPYLTGMLALGTAGCGGGGSGSNEQGSAVNGSSISMGTYTGTATINISRRNEILSYQLPVTVKLASPLTTVSGVKDPNPVYLRIEPSPPGSIQTNTRLGFFLIELSTSFGPGLIESATQIYQYWSAAVDGAALIATLTDQHRGPFYITNYIWLIDPIVGSGVALMFSLKSTMTASVLDSGLHVKIRGTIDDTVNFFTLAPFSIEMTVSR